MTTTGPKNSTLRAANRSAEAEVVRTIGALPHAPRGSGLAGAERTVQYERDFQKSSVYRSEDDLRAMLAHVGQFPTLEIAGSTVTLHAPLRFGALAQVQTYCDTVCANEGAAKLVVVEKPRTSRWARYTGGTIEMPSGHNPENGRHWAWREEVVLHELAHHLSPGHGHNGTFCGVEIDLFTRYISPEMGFLLRLLMLDNGVKIA